MSQFKGMPESRNGGFRPSWKLQTYSIYIENLSKIHVGLGTPPPPMPTFPGTPPGKIYGSAHEGIVLVVFNK